MADQSVRIIRSRSDVNRIKIIDSEGNDWASGSEIFAVNFHPLEPGKTPTAEVVFMNPILEYED